MSREGLSEETVATVETFVADWVSDERIPGAAVAIVDCDAANTDAVAGNGVVYADGFGARNLESNAPATPDTLFGVGSCTKAVTATAIMQLVERGALALDDHVDDYLPHLEDAPGDPITIEELLTHTSGMPSDAKAEPLITRAFDAGTVAVPLSSEADFRRHVQSSADHRVTDRDVFFYYNSGYTMLGRIVESVTGESFADRVEATVFDPLGMERSTFDRDAYEAESDRMTPYIADDDGPSEVGFPFDSFIQAAGGLLSSVRELAALLRLFSDAGRVGDETILSPESVDAMATPQGTFGTYFDGTEVGYGYGLMVEDYLADRLIGHGGSVAVSNAWFGYLESAGVGVTIACTSSPETHPAEAGMGILALLQDRDPEAVQPHYRLTSKLDAVTGEYSGHRGIVSATVERVEGALRLQIDSDDDGRELLLTPTEIADDYVVCTTTDVAGMTHDVRFEFDGDAVDCYVERFRLTK